MTTHDFDARLAAMLAAAGITDDSDPAAIIALHNRFTAELAAEGSLDAYKAQVFADLEAAGLMPAARHVAANRAQRRAARRSEGNRK